MNRGLLHAALPLLIGLLAGCVSGPIAGSSGPAADHSATTPAAAGVAGVGTEAVTPPPGQVEPPAPATPNPAPSASDTATATPTPTPSPTAAARPAPAPARFEGFFALGGMIAGPGEYRIGTSGWYIEVPAGMRLRWDFITPADAEGDVRWGWVDVASGSQLIVRAADVTDVARLLAGAPAAQALADRNFDALMASVSRQVAP